MRWQAHRGCFASLWRERPEASKTATALRPEGPKCREGPKGRGAEAKKCFGKVFPEELASVHYMFMVRFPKIVIFGCLKKYLPGIIELSNFAHMFMYPIRLRKKDFRVIAQSGQQLDDFQFPENRVFFDKMLTSIHIQIYIYTYRDFLPFSPHFEIRLQKKYNRYSLLQPQIV